MPSTGQFYANEQLTSGDLQTAVTLLNNSFTSLITRTLYANAFTILNGLAPSASSTADGGVQIASGLAYQNGQTVLVSTQQGVNILPGSYPNGTGLAADATYNRIDVVYITYAQGQSNLQTRSFAPPNETPYTESVYTEFVDGWTLSVVHGVASATPAVPSAPSGSVVLAQVLVPAGATTITSADITDETAAYRNDGGRLALATNGLLNYVSATHLGTPAGMKVGVGATAYMQDNTASGRLDIYGGTNGVSAYNPWYFRLSGTSIIVQPTTDAAAGTHMQSFRNASGTEYAWIDNSGNLSAAKGTFGGLATFNAGLTLPAGQTFTNAGTISGVGSVNLGGPLVGQYVKADGIGFPNLGNGGGVIAGLYGIDATQPILWENNDLLMLGKYNVSGSTQGVMPNATVWSFLQIDSNGRVGTGSWNNTAGTGSTFRNILDNGSGAANFAGLVTANLGVSVPGGQVITNAGSYAGSPLVTSLTATNGLSVTNPASPGAASYSLVLNGTSLSNGASGLSLNLGNANGWTVLQTFSAGITGTGTTGALTAGSGILGTANTWTAGQTSTASFNAPALRAQTTQSGSASQSTVWVQGWTGSAMSGISILPDNSSGGAYIATAGNSAILWKINPSGNIFQEGRTAGVSGVSTAGNFGVATVVAYAYEVELTGTAAQIVCQFTPTVDGLFEIRAYFRVVTGTTTVNVYATFTDASNTAQTIQLLPSTSEAVGDYSCLSVTVGATTSNFITLWGSATVANQVYVSGAIIAF